MVNTLDTRQVRARYEALHLLLVQHDCYICRIFSALRRELKSCSRTTESAQALSPYGDGNLAHKEQNAIVGIYSRPQAGLWMDLQRAFRYAIIAL